MRILLVEDHPDLSTIVQDELCKAGFATDLATKGREAFALLRLNRYNAMVLDLGLPDVDGMTLLKYLQSQKMSDVPCLVLTARDSLQSRVDALNAGADDYILKPFDMEELIARVRAVLRRPGNRQQALLNFGDITFDPNKRILTSTNSTLALTRREAMLMETLLLAAPRAVIKDHLEESLYSIDEVASLNAIEALVSRTRRKLGSLESTCKIETLRGIGYRLAY